MRYYLGVDWADQTHAVWVVDERGTKVAMRTVPHTAEGLSAWGRELEVLRAPRQRAGFGGQGGEDQQREEQAQRLHGGVFGPFGAALEPRLSR